MGSEHIDKEALEVVNRVVIDGVSCYHSAFNATTNTTRDYKNYLQTVISLRKSRAIISVFTSDQDEGRCTYYREETHGHNRKKKALWSALLNLTMSD